jgi:hypothetical protein
MPLYNAALGGYDDVVAVLEMHGAKYAPEKMPARPRDERHDRPSGLELFPPEAVARLLKIGVKLDIWAAARHGYTDRVREILREDPKKANGIPGASPLFYAAWGGHLDIANMLLDAGAVVDPDTPSGAWFLGTPLEAAASSGHLDVMRLLIDRGANVNYRDNQNVTLLGRLSGRTGDDAVKPGVLELLRARGAVAK